MVVKGINAEDSSETILQPIMTSNGELLHFNHEVMAAAMPVPQDNKHRGVAAVRWSCPEWANRCVSEFDRARTGNSVLRVSISDHPCKVESANQHHAPVRGRTSICQYAWAFVDEVVACDPTGQRRQCTMQAIRH